MSNSKPVIIACLISLVILSSLFLVSCFKPAASYKPSQLPSLIAFASDRDKIPHIFTIKPDGSDVRATSDDNSTTDGLPVWSPDGKKIAFASDQSDDYEISTMNEDGSGRTKVSNRFGWDGLPRWSPDGSKIAFVSELHHGAETSYEIFVINADGSGMKQLTDSTTWNSGSNASGENERLGWNSAPTWSPDSSKILFASNRNSSSISPILYTMNADGTDQKKFGLLFDVDGTDANWPLLPIRSSSSGVVPPKAIYGLWMAAPPSRCSPPKSLPATSITTLPRSGRPTASRSPMCLIPTGRTISSS